MDDRTKQRLLDVAKATIQAAAGTVAAACVISTVIRDGPGVHAGRQNAYVITRCTAVLAAHLLVHMCCEQSTVLLRVSDLSHVHTRL
jgi:hypothetical protein